MDTSTASSDFQEPHLKLYSILSKDVILRNLECFLGLEDLRNVRATNHEFNQLVLNKTKLLRKSRIVLTKKVITDPGFQDLQIFPKNLEIFPFKTANFWNDTQLIKSMVVVCKLAVGAKSLKVGNFDREDDIWKYGSRLVKEVGEIRVPEHFPNILQVVYSANNLQELILGEDAGILLSKAQEEDFRYLKNLEILRFTSLRQVYVPRIFLRLRGLKVLDYKSLCGCYCDCQTEQHLRFQKVVENNMETLRELGQLQPWFFKETEIPHPEDTLSNEAVPEGTADVLLNLQCFDTFPGKLEAISLFNPTIEALSDVFRLHKSLKRIQLYAVVMKEDCFLEALKLIHQMELVSLDLSLIALKDCSDFDAPIDLFSYMPRSIQHLSICLKGSPCSWNRIVYNPTSLQDLHDFSSFTLVGNGLKHDFVQSVYSSLKQIKHLIIRDLHK